MTCVKIIFVALNIFLSTHGYLEVDTFDKSILFSAIKFFKRRKSSFAKNNLPLHDAFQLFQFQNTRKNCLSRNLAFLFPARFFVITAMCQQNHFQTQLFLFPIAPLDALLSTSLVPPVVYSVHLALNF